MTDNEITEIMARAILDESLWLGAWSKANEVEKSYARYKATAALTALRSAGLAIVPREPTEAMMNAAQAAWTPGVSYGEAHAIRYRAMIATAEGKTE